MTPIETGQSETMQAGDQYTHPLDGRAVTVPETAEQSRLITVSAAILALELQRDAAVSALARARATLAEGVATADSTTARGGPLALCQAAKLALEEINASGVLT